MNDTTMNVLFRPLIFLCISATVLFTSTLLAQEQMTAGLDAKKDFTKQPSKEIALLNVTVEKIIENQFFQEKLCF
jgi:hypothetical protein